MFGREFQWFEAKLARADGGEVDDEVATDGGAPQEGDQTEPSRDNS
jgi:hypothetical protein